jgi:TonB-dependent SusC/RagA subfamily outer membrane receptor
MLLISVFLLQKRHGRQLLVGTSLMLLLFTVTFAQQRTVTGTVTSSSGGLHLQGVNVIIQGTSAGTVTNTEGSFSLAMPAGDVSLQFSSIGYTVQVVEVGKSTVVNVTLQPSLTEIDEVVITSLGIVRMQKRITYSAQNVETDNVAQARELNVANSLQGKVAGLDVIKSSSGLGSASRLVLRGNRFITGNNQPLYIVDGVPILNFSWGTPDHEYGGLQGGDGISNINPDDIASITVLKGPNATALYGSRANNGAIVLTTRQAYAGKGIGVEFNTNWSMERAMILTSFQDLYGQGNGGTYIKNSEEEWGPKMEGQMVDHWSPDPNFAGPAQYAYSPHNNFEDFFQTGYNIANTLALTAGNEKLRSLFSYTNTISQGIVEHNKLRRNNFNLRIDGDLTNNFSIDTKLTYFSQRVDNRLATGGTPNNPMRAIYRQPSNIS